MTAEQAEAMRLAIAGSYEATADGAAAACLQAAAELELVTEAIHYGAADRLVSSTLIALAARLRAAAQLAGDIELACDDAADAEDATAREARP